MNILITGGCGFIGSNVVERLIQDKNNFLTVIDDVINSDLINSVLSNNHNNIEFLTGDIRTNKLSDISKTYDVIIHLAAETNVRESFKHVDRFNNVNIKGLYSVLNFAVKSNTPKVIFTSSSSVYGSNNNYPWNEEDPIAPISPYAITKLMGEHIGHMYSKLTGIQFITLRLFNIFGPYMRKDLLMNKIYESTIKDNMFTIYGTGTQSRDFTHIDNVIHAIELCLKYPYTDTFNIGTGINRSVKEVINTMNYMMDKKTQVQYHPTNSGEIFKTLADISKAKDVLGYTVQTEFKEGLEKFIEYKNRGSITYDYD